MKNYAIGLVTLAFMASASAQVSVTCVEGAVTATTGNTTVNVSNGMKFPEGTVFSFGPNAKAAAAFPGGCSATFNATGSLTSSLCQQTKANANNVGECKAAVVSRGGMSNQLLPIAGGIGLTLVGLRQVTRDDAPSISNQ